MRTVHIVSHRGSSRLARVIPSMHVHLCVVWWLFSSPVSFSSPFRCSSSRLSRCLPPSSTRSSSPKTCATSAWGPWPVLTTRHPSQIMHRVVLDFSLCLLASCRLCFPSLLPAGCLTLSVCLSACHALRDVSRGVPWRTGRSCAACSLTCCAHPRRHPSLANGLCVDATGRRVGRFGLWVYISAKAESSQLLSRAPRVRSCSSAAVPAAMAMCFMVSGHFSTQTCLY